MNILIAGGSGFLGTAFSQHVREKGDRVWVLTRSSGRTPEEGIQYVQWDGSTTLGWQHLMDTMDAVINFCGENIGAFPWTAARKKAIRSSRSITGAAIVEAFRSAKQKPAVLLQASAIGFYGTSLNAINDENSPSGQDWQSAVCREWEASTAGVEALGVRRVILRSGLVLAAKEGILPKFMLPFQLFAGGPMGSGKQWVSWIHLQDELEIIEYLLRDNDAHGVYNLTAPQPVTNAEFGKVLGAAMQRPYWIPAPGFILKLVLGEMSTLVLDGQKVLPRRLLDSAYPFKFPSLEGALRSLLKG